MPANSSGAGSDMSASSVRGSTRLSIVPVQEKPPLGLRRLRTARLTGWPVGKTLVRINYGTIDRIIVHDV